MSNNELQFWFDFASTYSYVTAGRIDELAKPSGIRVRWMPFLLGPIFSSQGWNTSPFNVYPSKGAYMWRDMERLCKRHSLALNRPEVFPQFALLATRVGVAAEREGWQQAFCQAVFQAEYGRGEDITSREAVHDALSRTTDNPDKWLALAEQEDTKQALKDRVRAAQTLGIFGAPTFVTPDGELFWGDDRLDQAIEWMLKRR